MAKSMFFPNFKEKIPNSRTKKNNTILCHLNCTVPQQIVLFIPNIEMCSLMNKILDFFVLHVFIIFCGICLIWFFMSH